MSTPERGGPEMWPLLEVLPKGRDNGHYTYGPTREPERHAGSG